MPTEPNKKTTLEILLQPPFEPKRLEQALSISLGLLQKDAENPNLHILVGAVYLQLDRADEAISHLEKGTRLAPQNEKAWYAAGAAYKNLGNTKKAADAYMRAIDLEKEKGTFRIRDEILDAVNFLAPWHLKQRNWPEARDFHLEIINYIGDRIAKKHEAKGMSLPTYHGVSDKAPRTIYPVLYLPVEVKAREFQTKVLLATLAAQKGLTIVLGSTWSFYMNKYADLPPGIILFKTANHLDYQLLTQAVKNGHMTALLDEEAFGRSDGEEVFKLNCSASSLALIDLIFLQGEAQKQTLVGWLPEAAKKAVVTGNPKSDLLKDRFRGTDAIVSSALDKLEEKVILICLMSGNINNAKRDFFVCAESTLSLSGIPLNTDLGRSQINAFSECVEFELSMLPQITKVITAVAESFPNKTIVVRPHPVEEVDLWSSSFDQFRNVRVTNSGALTDWLPHTSAMIYIAGCSSGLESYLYGIPSIRFDGDGLISDTHAGVSSLINMPASRPEDVLAHLNEVLGKGYMGNPSPTEKETVERYLTSPKDSLAAESLVKELVRFGKGCANGKEVPVTLLENLDERRGTAFTPNEFQLNKFPDTPLEDVKKTSQNMVRLLGDASAVDIRKIGFNMFLFAPSN